MTIRQTVTSQTTYTQYKWRPYATEWNPPWEFSEYTTDFCNYLTPLSRQLTNSSGAFMD